MPEQFLVDNLPWVIFAGVMLGFAGLAGWVFTTWLRIKHGYPLETSWGKALEPRITTETAERLRLLSGENAQLRAELGSIKDRLVTVERIVTDEGHRLTQEIEGLNRPRQ